MKLNLVILFGIVGVIVSASQNLSHFPFAAIAGLICALIFTALPHVHTNLLPKRALHQDARIIGGSAGSSRKFSCSSIFNKHPDISFG